MKTPDTRIETALNKLNQLDQQAGWSSQAGPTAELYSQIVDELRLAHHDISNVMQVSQQDPNVAQVIGQAFGGKPQSQDDLLVVIDLSQQVPQGQGGTGPQARYARRFQPSQSFGSGTLGQQYGQQQGQSQFGQ